MIYILKLERVDLWSTNHKIYLWPVDLGIDATHHLIMGYIGATYKYNHWNMQCPKEQTQAQHAGRMERRMDGVKPIHPPSHTSLWVRYNDCEKYILDLFAHASWSNDLSHTQYNIFIFLIASLHDGLGCHMARTSQLILVSTPWIFFFYKMMSYGQKIYMLT